MLREFQTFHFASIIHTLWRRKTKHLLYGVVRERQMECYFISDHLFEIGKDPFLDICSFMEEFQLDMLEKRALVTKEINIIARYIKICFQKAKGTRFTSTNASQNWWVSFKQGPFKRLKEFGWAKIMIHCKALQVIIYWECLM